MAKRISSAAIGLIFLLIVLFVGAVNPILLDLCVALISAYSIFEIFTAINIKRAYYLVIPSMLFAFVIPMIISFSWWWIGAYVYTVMFFAIMIWKKDEYPFKDVIFLFAVTAIITIGLSTLAILNRRGDYVGTCLVVFALANSWFADTGAYFVGRAFGKHKLAPTISPKKTVEGVIGGIASSVLFTNLIGLLFERCLFTPHIYVSYILLTVIALVGACLAVFGDLCFSYMKRTCNIKDFGNIIPGHGGVLDRFDSVIFVAPFVCAMSLFLPVVTFINI